MANYTGNLFKYKLLTSVINFGTNTFKAKLMNTGFAFNRATHEKWSDVSAYELPSGNGYGTGGATLTLSAVTKDSVNNRVSVTWANPQWTASGGNIGPIAGLMVTDSTDTDECLVMYIPFSPELTQPIGGVFTVAGVEFDQVDTVSPD